MMTMSMLYKSSNRLLDLPKAHATRVAAKNYAVRYMIYAVVLVAAGLSDNLHVLLVGIGLFTFKVVLMTILFLEKRRGGK